LSVLLQYEASVRIKTNKAIHALKKSIRMNITLKVTAVGRLLSHAGVLPPTGYMLNVELAIKVG
jgi:hypothetical protein